MGLAFRRAEARDKRLIVDSFLESYRHAHAAGLISMESWRDVMAPQFERILSRRGVGTWVAYHPAERDPRADLYGWISVERDFNIPMRVKVGMRWEEQMVPCEAPLVHFIFVKQPYRRLGVARGLFKAAGVNPVDEFLYTAKTPVLGKLAAQIPLARWAPLVARYPK